MKFLNLLAILFALSTTFSTKANALDCHTNLDCPTGSTCIISGGGWFATGVCMQPVPDPDGSAGNAATPAVGGSDAAGPGGTDATVSALEINYQVTVDLRANKVIFRLFPTQQMGPFSLQYKLAKAPLVTSGPAPSVPSFGPNCSQHPGFNNYGAIGTEVAITIEGSGVYSLEYMICNQDGSLTRYQALPVTVIPPAVITPVAIKKPLSAK
jgi:hypothetical protein